MIKFEKKHIEECSNNLSPKEKFSNKKIRSNHEYTPILRNEKLKVPLHKLTL